MSDFFWALIAVLALGGWAATLVFMTKQQLPQANALCNLLKADAAVDDRLRAIVASYREIENRGVAKATEQQSRVAEKVTEAQTDLQKRIDAIFGAEEEATGVNDQPLPAGMEAVVS